MAPAQRASDDWLREKFNASDLSERRDGGLLKVTVAALRPARAGAMQPSGTMSVLEQWYDGEVLVAEVHFYRLPTGGIGASGRYDPKGMRVGDTWWYVT